MYSPILMLVSKSYLQAKQHDSSSSVLWTASASSFISSTAASRSALTSSISLQPILVSQLYSASSSFSWVISACRGFNQVSGSAHCPIVTFHSGVLSGSCLLGTTHNFRCMIARWRHNIRNAFTISLAFISAPSISYR